MSKSPEILDSVGLLIAITVQSINYYYYYYMPISTTTDLQKLDKQTDLRTNLTHRNFLTEF